MMQKYDNLAYFYTDKNYRGIVTLNAKKNKATIAKNAIVQSYGGMT